MSSYVGSTGTSGGGELKDPLMIYQKTSGTTENVYISFSDTQSYIQQGYTYMFFALNGEYKSGDTYRGGGLVGNSFLPLQIIVKLYELQRQDAGGSGGNGYYFWERLSESSTTMTAHPFGVYYCYNASNTAYAYPNYISGSGQLEVAVRRSSTDNGRYVSPTIYVM